MCALISLFSTFFPFFLFSLPIFYSSVYKWEMSRSLITQGCMVLIQMHYLLILSKETPGHTSWVSALLLAWLYIVW